MLPKFFIIKLRQIFSYTTYLGTHNTPNYPKIILDTRGGLVYNAYSSLGENTMEQLAPFIWFGVYGSGIAGAAAYYRFFK
tara:strand:- start:2475 stop:2714 length:240 start_codon:yes stop_codon:yes gene_type:complete